MQHVNLQADTLNNENLRFAQAPLGQSLFLNSVPKSGSHLLRNIVRMFVPVEQQYQQQFIQYGNLDKHVGAFENSKKLVSWGHLLFSDASAIELAGVRKILLVRDPYSWVIARARFFLSDEFKGNLEHIKNGALTISQLFNLMIFGIYEKTPSLSDIYTHNALAWLGTDVHLVRYEDIVAHLKSLESDAAEAYFTELLDACGIALSADWRDRVRVGSDPAQSGTARQNLTGNAPELPSELPTVQRQLVDQANPGLRQILGYA